MFFYCSEDLNVQPLATSYCYSPCSFASVFSEVTYLRISLNKEFTVYNVAGPNILNQYESEELSFSKSFVTNETYILP